MQTGLARVLSHRAAMSHRIKNGPIRIVEKEHLRRRLDTLLNAANAIDFEAGQAASAWNDYQQFSNRNQNNRQSGLVT